MKSKEKKRRHDQAGSSPQPGAGGGFSKRVLYLGLLVLLTFAGSWAFFEFVVWNRIPAALVGKWVVVGGEQDGATFDFFRNGTMVGRINMRGKEALIEARVAVEGETLIITTENPMTRRDETTQQIIKTLNAKELVLQDERNNLFKMERARE